MMEGIVMKDINESRLENLSKIDRLLLIIPFLGAIGIIYWELRYSRYGFDFTDESYYLMWMANPATYDWGVSLFGFIYHPIYRLFNGNIAILRQVNILLTFSLTYVLCYNLLSFFGSESKSERVPRILLSTGFATGSLIAFNAWLTTPSYNTLALQALLIAALGFLLAERHQSGKSVTGWVLIGVGGWLAFCAKPSTAAALACCAVLYIFVGKKFHPLLILVSILTTLILFLATAILIDGSIGEFITRFKKGIEYTGYFYEKNTFDRIFRWDQFALDIRERAIIIGLSLFAFFSAFLIYSDSLIKKLIGVLSSSILLVIVIITIIGLVHDNFLRLDEYQYLITLSLPLSAIFLGLTIRLQGKSPSFTRAHWSLALVLMIFPNVYIFGSGNNYWRSCGVAGIFWLLAGLVLCAPIVRNTKKWSALVPLALITQVVVVFLVQNSLDMPYRQPRALRYNNQAVEVGKPGSRLYLADEFADYINTVSTSVKKAGFTPGTPVIDLSGQSPGVLHVMEAKGSGAPWIIGGYPNSLQFAVAALSHLSQDELHKAWILIEPEGPRSIPNEVFSYFGIDLEKNYTEVASWQTAKGAGGYEEQRQQILFRPVIEVGQ
jgi:hypothetical protein